MIEQHRDEPLDDDEYPRTTSRDAHAPHSTGEDVMATKFSVDDHVRWNSEAGYVQGTITRVHTEDVDYKGHTRRCSPEEPQYEIKSDKTDHIAMHKGSALTKI